MKAIFLADAHLRSEGGQGYQAALDFLSLLAKRRKEDLQDESVPWVDKLFLLGDIFDLWFARGSRVYPPYREVIRRLAELQGAGVEISLCEGNHDFFLEEYFSLRMGMKVYPEGAELTMDGKRVWISHGDLADANNRRYLIYRRLLRSRFSFIMQRLTPLALLWATASLASQASRNLAKDRTEELAVIFEKFAREKLAKGACDMIIFGHCHKPVVLEYPFGDKVKTAAIPGAWINHRSYLYFADGVLSLRYFEG